MARRSYGRRRRYVGRGISFKRRGTFRKTRRSRGRGRRAKRIYVNLSRGGIRL